MAYGSSSQAPSSNPAIQQLEGTRAKIGVTTAHKQIIALILIGCLCIDAASMPLAKPA